MRFLRVAGSALKWSLFLVLLPLVEIVALLLILSVIPIFIYRCFIQVASRLVRRDFGEMLSSLSALSATDNFFKRPRYTVILYHFTEGRISMEEHKKLWMDKVLNVRLPSGQLKYPELRQYVTSWGLFYFWKNDKQFNIDNHIKFYEHENPSDEKSPAPLDEEFIARVCHGLLKKPFIKGESPWEVLIVPNARTNNGLAYGDSPSSAAANSNPNPNSNPANKEQSLIFIRYHHVLADGFSITQLLSNLTSGEWFKDPAANFRLSLWKKALCMMLYPFIASAVMIPMSWKYMDRNEWIRKGRRPTNRVNYALSPPISLEQLKSIKNSHGVSLQTVFYTIFTGAFRNYMLQVKTRVPRNMHVGIPLPIPGRPDKLTNHVTAGFFKIPTGLSDPLKRLHQVETELRKLKKSMVPMFVGTFGQFYFGIFPTFLIRLCRKVGLGTGSLSLFPGPLKPVTYYTGEKILTLGCSLDSAFLPKQAVIITGISYAGSVRFTMGVDESIIPNQEHIKDLLNMLEDEVKILSSYHIV